MKEQFVSYEIALALKELGVDEECLGVFDNQTKELLLNDTKGLSIKNIPTIFTLAPLWQQAFRWLREVHNLNISINIMVDQRYNGYYIEFRKGRKYVTEYQCALTYERAIEVAINKSIELIKSTNYEK